MSRKMFYKSWIPNK